MAVLINGHRTVLFSCTNIVKEIHLNFEHNRPTVNFGHM